jgi:hypothetical protein
VIDVHFIQFKSGCGSRQSTGTHDGFTPYRFLPAVTREEVIYYDCCCLSRTRAPYHSTFFAGITYYWIIRLSEPKQAFPMNLRLGVSIIAGGVNAQCFI